MLTQTKVSTRRAFVNKDVELGSIKHETLVVERLLRGLFVRLWRQRFRDIRRTTSRNPPVNCESEAAVIVNALFAALRARFDWRLLHTVERDQIPVANSLLWRLAAAGCGCKWWGSGRIVTCTW